MSPKMPGRLSVKGVAGVTLRTARYHHSIGVLPEPPRGGAGYRRYGGKEVIELVQVGRSRALRTPLPQIAQRVGASASDDVSLTDALGSISDTLDAEIGRLVATRNRLREPAGPETFSQPVPPLAEALPQREVLGPAEHLQTVLPSDEVDGQVDTGSVELLLTDRLNPSQRRFQHQLRTDVEGTR